MVDDHHLQYTVCVVCKLATLLKMFVNTGGFQIAQFKYNCFAIFFLLGPTAH